jgi:hypothetical protein
MKPSISPIWRVVIQRLASATEACPIPPPGGRIWSSSAPSIRPIMAAKAAELARTQPARSTTPERPTTPGNSVPRASLRRGTIRAIVSA